MVYISILKAPEVSLAKKICELITEHFLNMSDHENFFPKEYLLISLKTTLFQGTVWDTML